MDIDINELTIGKSCNGCKKFLKEPFILCAECKFPHYYLCPACFARGFENGNHLNSHNYEVIRSDFSLLETNWSAVEEIKLLDAISDAGYGNWKDVACRMTSKNSQQCEEHYNKKYIENSDYFSQELSNSPVYPLDSVPLIYKICDDPPRSAVGSQLYNEMAGYMPPRGDFCTEYDNFAENDICNMEFHHHNHSVSDIDEGETQKDDFNESDVCETELKLAVLEIFNRRLKERKRRKTILSRHGLIHTRKAMLSFRQYDSTIGRRNIDGIMPFMQLVNPIEFDFILQSFKYESELKSQIRVLQECREVGVKKYSHARLYSQIKHFREENRYAYHFMDNILDHMQNDISCHQWLHRQTVTDAKQGNFTGITPHLHRRHAPPLDISGLPGNERLNAEEKELCSIVRLVPEAYLEFKLILITEYQKQGSLRLAQARNLIKIDVNKTRKLFDFLVSEGYINTEKK